YFAWTGFSVGCALLLEIGYIYLTAPVIQEGAIERSHIFTGWGMYNNIGAMLAMMIPFPFYLATQYRRGWLGTLAASMFLIGVLFTCSRASILCGGAVYFLCVILVLYYTGNPRANAIALLLFAGGLFLFLTLFSRPLLALFDPLLDRGLDPSNRDKIYADGMKLFAKYPIFGGSFFSTEFSPWGWSTVKEFTNFLPPRWHNTFVQLLASCGIVGVLAYLIHRLQTVLFLLRHRTPEKIFTYASLLVLLTCSLFDCHFFNLGPVLFYSAALAFAEYH
ncbi:MAG: O-antigen ligase family protein, partial [Oscillospiraceae bacterium]|nr:O-antigen ligase family protein [Oscillospiraceae bacterium]